MKKNYVEITLEDCSQKITQPNLFDLSRPIKMKNTKNFIPNLDNQAMFEFVKPNRAQPYTLRNPDKKNGTFLNSSSNGTYHHTAILARLSSISNTFRSIFVRPKNSKPIDLGYFEDPKSPDFEFEISTCGDPNSRYGDRKLYSSSSVSTLSATSDLTCDAILNMNTLASKWTCMVCLCKHKMDVAVCSICGCEKQIQKNSIKQSTSNTLKTIGSNRPQATQTSCLKTWSCSYCSFANDSLKIVCMNCRSSKQMRKDQVQESVQLKRARRSRSKELDTGNEENELEQSGAKKSKQNENDTNNKDKNKLLTSNTNSLHKTCSAAESTTHNLATPTKPLNFYNTAKQSWTCPVCLVNNDHDTNSCVCCTTVRQDIKQKSDKINDSGCSKFSIGTNEPAKQDNTQEKLKWKCQNCLVLNDEEKKLCVCCSTAHDNSQTSKIKSPNFTSVDPISMDTSFGLKTNNVSVPFSFGLKTNNLSMPISFGSNFSVSKPNSGFSFDNEQKKSDKKNDPLRAQSSFGTKEPVKQNTELPSNDPKDKNQANIFSMRNAAGAPFTTSEPVVLESELEINEQNKPTLPFAANTQTSKTHSMFSFESIETRKLPVPIFDSSSKPQFSFGSSPSFLGPSSTNSKPFFSTAPPTEPTNSAFVSSTTDSRPAFSFDISEVCKPVLFGATIDTKNIEDNKSSFAFGRSTETTKTNNMSPVCTNLFSTPKPVLFGLMPESQKTNQLTALNFGNQGEGQKAGNFFNFGSNSSQANNAPISSIGMDHQNNFITSNLTEVLSSQANASKRVIKKPARRLRK